MARTVQLFKYEIPRGRLIAAAAIGGVLLLALLATLAAPAFIDWNRYRAPLAEMVAESLGRGVEINGDMSFRPLPVPSLRAGNVRIANPADGQATYLADVRRLDMDVALWPLLRGRLQLRRVELVEPVIHLERLPDGRGNWESPIFAGDPDGGREIGIDSLRLSEGRLDYRTADGQRLIALSGLSGRFSAETIPGPLDIALEGRAAGRAFAIELALDRPLQDGRIPASGKGRLGDLTADYRGLVAAGGGLPTRATDGRLSIETPSLAAAIGDLAAIAGHDAPSGSLLALAEMPLALAADIATEQDASASMRLTQASLGETALSGEMTLRPGAVWRLEAALSGDRLDLDRIVERIDDPVALERALLALEGPAGLDGGLDFDLDALSLGDGVISRLALRLETEAGRWRLPRLTAQGPGASRLSLALSQPEDAPGAAGSLYLAAGDLRRALRWLSIAPALPETALLQGSLKTSLKLRPRAYALSDARLRLDGMEMAGELLVDMTGGRPAVTARLRAPRIEVDSYIPPDRKARDVITGGLSALARVDGDIDIAIDRLDAAGLALRGVEITAASDESGLQVGKGRIGDVLGSTLDLSGRLSAAADAPEGRLALTLRSPDAESLARALDLPQPAILRRIGPGEIMADLLFEPNAVAGVADAIFAGGRLTVDGRVTGWPWAPARSVALKGDLLHPDHRGLARRLGLDWLDRGEGGPLALAWDLTGDRERVAGAIELGLLGGRLAVSGALAEPLSRPHPDGALQVSLDHPDGLWLARGLGLPRARTEGPALPLALSARIGGAPDIWSLESLSLQAGPDRLAGAGRLDVSGERPRLEVELAAESLALDRILLPSERPVRHGDWSRRALPTRWLTALDGALDLRADRVSYAGLDAQSLSLAAALEDGVLDIDPLSAGLLGGALRAQGRIAPVESGLQLAADIDWRDAPLQRVSALLMGVEPLTGTGRIGAEIETSGASPHDLIAGMTGSLSLSGAALALEGLDLGVLSRRIAEADDPRDLALLDLAGWRNGSTPLVDVALEGVLSAGQLTFADATLSGPAGRIDGALRVDLAGWRVSGTGAARLAAHPDLPAPGVNIAGPLSDPRLALDLVALRQRLAGRLSKPPVPALAYGGPPRAALYGAPATVGDGADS